MSKIYKDILVPIPENAYVNKCDARVYLVREKVYLPDMQYNSDKRKVVGRAANEKEMHPNSTFRLLFPEIFRECSVKVQVPPATKVIGSYAAFLAMSKNTGLYELLMKSFGLQHADAIMDYTVYSILSQSGVAEDFRATREKYLLFSDGMYDDSWLSTFLKDRLPDQQAQSFRSGWIARCREQGVREAWICIDGSRDGCDAVSYMWAVSANDGMPVTYCVSYGSQIDGKVLKGQKAELEANDIAVKGVILDSGFCDADSLGLLAEEGIPYVVRMKRDASAQKELVEKYGKELRLSNVHYLIQRAGVYGISTKVRLFPEDLEEAYVSLYYDSAKGAECVNRLMEKVKAEMEEALAGADVDGQTKVGADCQKYINIIRDGHGTKIGINQEALQEDIDNEGFLGIASSQVMTADEKDAVYRLGQASGEQYAIFKAQMGLDALGVLSGESWAAKFAVGFIAGILRTEFENVCRKLGADRDAMLKELCQLYITMLPGKGYRMMHMESGGLLALLKELGVWMSDLDDIAVQENKRLNGTGTFSVRSLQDHGIIEL